MQILRDFIQILLCVGASILILGGMEANSLCSVGKTFLKRILYFPSVTDGDTWGTQKILGENDPLASCPTSTVFAKC